MNDTPTSKPAPRGSRLTRLVIGVAVVCLLGVGLAIVLDTPDTNRNIVGTVDPIAGPGNAGAAPIVDLGDPGLNVELAQGGWVQIAGPDGELAQQYRFEHLDPDPHDLATHWLRMREPRIQMFLRGGRMVTLTGAHLDAYAPKRALEQGRLEGDVIIRLYEGSDAPTGTVDPSTLEPALVVRTAWATFDNLAGRIECPEAITAVSPTERMAGRDLLVLMNDRENRIEFLRLAQVDYLALQERSVRGDHAPTGNALALRTIHRASLQDTAPSDATPVDWYRVRLESDVRIEQEDQTGRRLALGDTLDVMFSMHSGPLTRSTMVAHHGGPMTATGLLAAAAVGAADTPIPAPGEIIVTCTGPLTMVPLADDQMPPPTPDATRLELRGAPVRLLDTSDRIGAIAARMEYRSETERVDLMGSADQDVVLMTDDLWLRTNNLWAELGTGLAGSTDTPGHARMLNESPLELALLNEDAAHLDPDAPATLEDDLSIVWTGGVDVHFEPGGGAGEGEMKLVRFQGDVEVRSPDGSINASTLEMHFQPDSEGQARPDRMFATGNVRAKNEDQTLWTDVLTATLEPSAASPTDASAADPSAADAPAKDPMANARIKDFFAEGDVQVLLADGARAFADVLEGDARQERVVLKGRNIVIARSDLLIEHGREVFIERKEGKATWPGGGRARLLARPIDVTQDTRITRPAVPAPTREIKRVVTMQATWNDGLLYDSKHDNGAGALNLAGKVAVVTQQKPTERASLHGGKLRLEFASIADSVPAGTTTTGASPTSGNAGLFAGDGRVLSRMISDDAARLERRTWPTEDRLETPEIVYIGGDRITWDDLNVKAAVEGNGDFVTRQPSWAASDGEGPFRGAGTARFTWTKRLDMQRRDDGRFTIDMKGMVEGMWKGANDPEDIATLTADQVQAVTRRDVGTNEEHASQPTPLDFDGDASIEQMIATGRVYLATPTRRADADRLDYNTRTGIARLEGRPGHPVAVVNEGAPLPVRATAMIWNMDPDVDTITLESPRGVGGR